MSCPPPISLSAGATEYTFDSDGNLHIPPSTQWSQHVDVSHVRSDGYCTGYYSGYCNNTSLKLSSAYWTITGSQSGTSCSASNVYVCPTCGYQYTGNQSCSSIAEFITYKHYNHNDYTRDAGRLLLCTANLTEETHDASYTVITDSAKSTYCECGSELSYNVLYGCEGAGCPYNNQVAGVHKPGSQTSTACGGVRRTDYTTHPYIRCVDCPQHPGYTDIHYVDDSNRVLTTSIPYMGKPSWVPYGFDSCFTSTYCRKISEIPIGNSYSKCDICGYTAEQHSMAAHKAITQETQTISIAGLSYMDKIVQSVEFPSSVNGIVVNGAKTSLSYTSTNQNVLEVHPNSGAAMVKGIGTAIITVTAAETPEWTAATATAQITVTKGNLKITVLPSSSSITYGQALSASTLTGGTAVNRVSNAVAGLFSWKDSSVYAQNAQVYAVRFIPTDTQNYNY